MIEYPSIINSSKAPRQNCIAFDKLDGSNFRAKYTQKRGFDCFGTRTQLINETTPFWKEMVEIFNSKYKEPLENVFKKEKSLRDYREIVVFGEFLGENSFAGHHEDEPHDLVFFDIMVGHKQRKFLKPLEFVKTLDEVVPIPKVVYAGNLNDEFIQSVRDNVYGLKEGVICKGTETNGAFCGNTWMCKIKTNEYFQKLKDRFKDDWEKYSE
jgi:hypothetical protein